MERKPVVLVIRDGWGENHNSAHDAYNAVKLAKTPCEDRLRAEGWPRTEIAASGEDVGLPDGIMGNSEVGHQNIGAGRIVDQELLRINKGFREGKVAGNEVLNAAIEKAKSGGKLHLFGLVSDAGVHAMLEHLYGLLQVAKAKGVAQAYVHAFTDGRDTPPNSGKGYIEAAEKRFGEIGLGVFASVSGRYWAMDRDNRWGRVQKAYDALTGRDVPRTAASATEAIASYYENPSEPSMKGDEFIEPTAIVGDDGQPLAVVEDGDAVIFFNFRGDRPRELTRAFLDDDFDGFDRGPKLDLYYATMTEYQKGLCENVIFRKPEKMVNILGKVVADRSIPQFRCAETEKFPHVTFFFNDYREEPFDGEDRKLIPSPQEVSTYDQKPEMAAPGITEATLEAIRSKRYGLIVVNYANGDMVGHTGNLDAAVKAVEVVDESVAQLLAALDEVGGRALITADHGNSDQMKMEDGSPHTAHTTNPVEVILYGRDLKNVTMKDSGRLADIAPTLLWLMDEEIPGEMTGDVLGG